MGSGNGRAMTVVASGGGEGDGQNGRVEAVTMDVAACVGCVQKDGAKAVGLGALAGLEVGGGVAPAELVQNEDVKMLR